MEQLRLLEICTLQSLSERKGLESKISELQFELAESSQQLLAVSESNQELNSQLETMKAELEKVCIIYVCSMCVHILLC